MRRKGVIVCGLAALITACTAPQVTVQDTPQSPASPPGNPGCPASRPIIVWDHFAGQEPISEFLSDQNAQCQPTLNVIGSSGPAGVTYCIKVAYVSDNPGYNPDLVPAAPMAKVFAVFGSGC